MRAALDASRSAISGERRVAAPMRAARPRLLFVVNSDWFFLSHRLPVARAARAMGFEVLVAAIDTGSAAAIESEGLSFLPLPMSHSGINPLRELGAVRALRRLYRRHRPDIVHHVTIKPVLYGSLAARSFPGMAVVNAVSGRGYVFSSRRRAAALRLVVRALYRIALRSDRAHTIFQNPEDRQFFVDARMVRRERTTLIRGSGVDCSRFRPAPEPAGAPVVMLASRMLWDKGVAEFVGAARLLRASAAATGARFALVGRPDPGNPAAVPAEQLEAWARAGMVEWWGHRDDMPAVLRQAAVVVLPTFYPEGVPKVLIEAAACGRAIVATDAPGCREVVRPGVNGLLVPPHDILSTAEAIDRLLRDPELRGRFGREGRRIATAEFSEQGVVAQTLDVYRALLGARWPTRRDGGASGEPDAPRR